MPVVSVAETSESSLFAKVDIKCEKDVIALRYTSRNVFFIWYGFWKQEVCNTRGNKMTSG